MIKKKDIRNKGYSGYITNMKKKEYVYKSYPEIITTEDLKNCSSNIANILYKEKNNCDEEDVLSLSILPTDVIIAIQSHYINKDNEFIPFFKYQKINIKNIDEVIKNDNHNMFEVSNNKRDLNIKFIVDIDNKVIVDKYDKEARKIIKKTHDDAIKLLINETMIFLNRIEGVSMKLTDILITTSNGYENKHAVYSNHIIFPIKCKCNNLRPLYNIVDDAVFSKYEVLDNFIIDSSVYKSCQNMRMLFQSKSNSIRIKLPNKYKKEDTNIKYKVSDYLTNIYREEDELNIPSIDAFILKTIDEKNDDKYKYHTKAQKNINTIQADQHTNYLQNDELTYKLWSIPNDIKVIQFNEWINIMRCGTGIVLYFTEHPELFAKHNSYSNPIDMNNFPTFVKELFTKWTISGYLNKPKCYNNYSYEALVQLAKQLNLKNYSQKTKEVLTQMILDTDTTDYLIQPDMSHHIKYIDELWDKLLNNHKITYINKIKRDFSFISKLSKQYNKDNLTKLWTIENKIPPLINVNNQTFFEYNEYPEYSCLPYDLMLKTENKKFCFFSAMMGLGKTDNIFKDFHNYSKSSILIISPRITFTTAIVSRFNEEVAGNNIELRINSYLEAKVDKLFFNNPKKTHRLVISPESVWKVDKYQYDIIMIDEIDTLLYSLNGDTCKKQMLYSKRINKIMGYIERADKVYFAEALPSIATASFMKHVVKIENKKSLVKINLKITEPIKFYNAYSKLKELKYDYNISNAIHVYKNDLPIISQYITPTIDDNEYNMSFNPNSLQSQMILNTLVNINKQPTKIHAFITDAIRYVQKYELVCSYTSSSPTSVEKLFLNDLIADLKTGNKINALITGRVFLKNIHTKLLELGIKSVVIHSENKSEMAKYMINNGELYDTDDIQFVGYTTSLSVGVSCDSRRWTKKYLYNRTHGNIADVGISSSQLFQGNIRFRNTATDDIEPQLTRVYLSFNNNSINNFNITPEDIKIRKSNYDDIIKEHLLTYIENNEGYETLNLANEAIFINYTKWNTLYQNGEAKRIINDKNEFVYSADDNGETFTINQKYLKLYKNTGFALDEDYKEIVTDLHNNIRQINNVDTKYLESMLKYKTLSYKNIWDDTKTIRSFAEKNIIKSNLTTNEIIRVLDNNLELADLKQELADKRIEEIEKRPSYSMKELQGNDKNRNIFIKNCEEGIIREYQRTFNQYYYNIFNIEDFNTRKDDSYFMYINQINKITNDPLFNPEEMRDIQNVYSLINYIKENNSDLLYIPIKKQYTTKLINTLILYYHPKSHLKNSNVDKHTIVSNNVLNWLFKSIIDEKIFISNFNKVIISSTTVEANKDNIDEHFKAVMLEYNLKSRFCEKTVSKLSIIIKTILDIDLNVNVPKEQKYINKTRVYYSEYNLCMKPTQYYETDTDDKNKKKKQKVFIPNEINETLHNLAQDQQTFDAEIKGLIFQTILQTFLYNTKLIINNSKDECETDNNTKYPHYLYPHYIEYTELKNKSILTDDDYVLFKQLNIKYKYYTDNDVPIEVIDEPIEIVEQTIEVIDELIEVIDNPIEIVEETIEDIDELIEIVEETIEVIDEPIEIVEETIEIIDEPIEVIDISPSQKRTLIIKQMDELIVKHTKLQDPENIDVLKMFIQLTQEVKDYTVEDYMKL